MVIKLYRKESNRVVDFHEAFLFDGRIHEHWGKVGNHGENRSHPRMANLSVADQLEQVLLPVRERGFGEIDIEDHAVLLVEYKVDGMGTAGDIEKIVSLTDLLQDVLGQSGLGYCDGHSIGSGTIEACCYVVDFDVAKRVIIASLARTRFEDFTRVFDEGAD